MLAPESRFRKLPRIVQDALGALATAVALVWIARTLGALAAVGAPAVLHADLLLTLLISAVLFVASELTRPKPDIENARPAGLGDFNFPTATEDRDVPVFWGTVMFEAPNVVWSGDLYQQPIKETVKTGLWSKETFIKGYRYHLGLQLALSRGLDTVTRILVGEKEMFAGSQGAGTFEITGKEGLFGGDDLGNGGVGGTLELKTGAPGQTASSYLETFQTISAATTPAAPTYPGTAYLVARQFYLGNSTQIQPWKIEALRIPNPLGFSGGEEAINSNADANPMNALYEILTNTEWGLGEPAGNIDIPQFIASGQTLHSEGNGWSFLLTSRRDVGKLIEEIERQCAGVLVRNVETGKLQFKLARADYSVGSLPHVTDDECLEVEEYYAGTWEEVTNEITVIFSHRENDYKSAPAKAQDPASIRTCGRVIPGRMTFPGVKDPDNAADIAWRELRAKSMPLRRARLRVNREFYSTTRGDVIRWTNTARGISQLPMRVGGVNYGQLLDGAIVLELVEDVYFQAAAGYGAPPETKWTPPADELGALPTDEQLAFEAPRAIVARDPSRVGAIADRIWCGARQQDVAVSFEIHQRNAAGTPAGSYAQAGEVFGYLLIGELQSALAAGSAVPLTTLVLTPDPDTQAAILAVFGSESGETIGADLAHLMLIGSDETGEFIACESAEAVSSNVQLNNVYRGLLDSTQQAHASGTPVWLCFFAGGLTETVFPAGNNVDIKLLPRSRSDTVAIGDATEIAIALANRIRLPYPPSQVLLNGIAYDDDASLEGTGSGDDAVGLGIGWTRRDFRTADGGNEVEALTTDAASLFGDFPAEHSTVYDVEVRADPSGDNTLLVSYVDVQPTQTLTRNEILRILDGEIPTTIRVTITAKHTFEGSQRSALQDLVFDFNPTSELDGDFNFGALDSFEESAVYTATVAGTYAFTIGTEMPGSGELQYRVNGGSWTTLISSGTTGNIAGVLVNDTIEIRHTESTDDYVTFVEMDAPGAGQDGYAVLETGAFAPDVLPEITAWWNFSDDADLNLSGTNINGALDKVGSNDLAQSGTERPNTVDVGGMQMARFLESSTQHLSVANDAALNFGSGDFSIFTVSRTGDNERAVIIAKGVAKRYLMRIHDPAATDDGKFVVDIDDDTTNQDVVDDAEDYADDVVRILTARRDGTNLRSYADGAETAASPTSIGSYGSLDGTEQLSVGARSDGLDDYFDGEIGEIIMYKGALTDGEVSQVHAWLADKWGITI